MALSRRGYNESRTVSVWSNNNRFKVSSKDFIDVVQSAKPAVIVALSDGDTPKGNFLIHVMIVAELPSNVDKGLVHT